jgi:hypothetical protein
MSETAVNRSVRDGVWVASAIQKLWCSEAREGVETGQLSRYLLDWIRSNAHRCRDERLLVDTFGF